MPRRTKIQRYDDILQLPNVTYLEYFREGEFADMRNNWSSVFPKRQPVTLELACGKGDYVLELGARYPHRNFIGIDIKGDRLWKGALQAQKEGLANVHFVRAQIDHLCHYFAPGEADEIWITFPDPYPRKSKKKKRLTHPVFLNRYAQVIKPGGLIHLKTDSELLYSFTLKIVAILNLPIALNVPDLYGRKCIPKDLDIQTYYEKQHLHCGRTIKYLSFRLNDAAMKTSSTAFDHLS